MKNIIFKKNKYNRYLFSSWIIVYSIGLFLLLTAYYFYILIPIYTISIIIPLRQQTFITKLQSKSHLFSTNRNVSRQQFISILSTDVLKKAVAKTAFQITYFKETFIKNVELKNNESPIKVVIFKNEWLLTNDFSVTLHGNDYFEVNFYKKKAVYQYNRLIKQNGCEFLIKMTNSSFSPATKILVKISGLDTVLKDLRSSVVVSSPNPDSSKALLSIKTSDVNKAVNLLTAIKSTYLDSNTDSNLHSIGVINRRVDSLGNDLKKYTAISTTIQSKNQNEKLVANYQEPANIAAIKKQADILNVIKSYLNIPNNQFAFVPNTFDLNDIELKFLISGLNEDQIKKQRLLRTDKPGAVALLKENQRITVLKSAARKRIDSLSRNLKNALNRLYITKLLPSLAKDRVETVVLNTLMKKEQTRAALSFYLAKKQELDKTKLAFDSTLNNSENHVRIVRDNKLVVRVLIAALLVGLLIPLPFIFFKANQNYGLAINEVIGKTNIPILGNVDYDGDYKTTIFPSSYETFVGAQLMKIKDSIENCKNHSTILFTSINPGDGKSFLAKNIAIALGADGKTVLLIQTGFNKVPNDMLDNEVSRGLYSFFENDNISLENISYKTNFDNVSIIESGKFDPAKLLDYIRMQSLIEKAKSKYEFIIIDSWSTGINEVNNLIKKQIDMIVTVLSNSSSSYSNLASLNQLYKNPKERNLYLIVNKNFFCPQGNGFIKNEQAM